MSYPVGGVQDFSSNQEKKRANYSYFVICVTDDATMFLAQRRDIARDREQGTLIHERSLVKIAVARVEKHSKVKDSSVEKLMNGLVNNKRARKNGINENDENLYSPMQFYYRVDFSSVSSLETRVFHHNSEQKERKI